MNALESVTQQLHYAARSLGRRRVLASVALTTLALGIGANTAIFSVIKRAPETTAVQQPRSAWVAGSERAGSTVRQVVNDRDAPAGFATLVSGARTALAGAEYDEVELRRRAA